MATNLKQVRVQLETEKARLEEELVQLQHNVPSAEERREGSPFGKREEEAAETMELEKRLALENRARGQIAAIDHTLEKIEKGTYGVCDNCGKKIAEARLEAMPSASLCLECKSNQVKDAQGNPYPV